MGGKSKDRGKTKSLDELIKRRPTRMPTRRPKQPSSERDTPRNFFPFVPARPGCRNPLGLTLDKTDCKVLNAVQKGAKTVKEICKVGKISGRKFRERLDSNPDLVTGFSLLMKWKLAIAAPYAADVLVEELRQKGFMELYLKVIGAIEEPSLKIIQKFGDDRLMSEQEIKYLIQR